jgi:hypothetical protein
MTRVLKGETAVKRIARFALAGIVLVACSIGASSGAARAAAGLPNPCKLLSRTEVQALIQLKVQAPDNYGTSCSWVADFNGPSGQVQIFLDTTTPRALRIDRKLHHRFRSIRGIGDQAFEEDWNIFVRKGPVWMYLSLVKTDDPGLYAKRLERAARLAVSRIHVRTAKVRTLQSTSRAVLLSKRRWSPRERRFGGSVGRYPGVVYQPNVVVIGGGANAVRSSTPDGLLWTIDARAPGASDLRVGKIMLATSFASGRVLKVSHLGRNLQVILAPVALTEIVRDGEFKSSGPVPLGHSIVVRSKLTPPKGKGRKPRALTGSGSPDEFTTQTTCCEGGVGVHIHYDDHSSGRLNALVLLHIEHPTVTFDIGISLSKLVEAKFELHGSGGLRYDIRGATYDTNGSVKSPPIPVPYTDTIPLAGPLSLTLSQAFKVSFQLAGKAALQASGDYSLDGTLGFRFGAGGARADAVTMTTQKAITKNTISLGAGLNAISIGWKLRATVGIGLVGFSAGAFYELKPGIALVADETPLSLKHGCVKASLDVTSSAGVGYTIPSYALSVINAILGVVHVKPIPAHGGPEWGPFVVWRPPPGEYCPQSGG